MFLSRYYFPPSRFISRLPWPSMCLRASMYSAAQVRPRVCRYAFLSHPLFDGAGNIHFFPASPTLPHMLEHPLRATQSPCRGSFLSYFNPLYSFRFLSRPVIFIVSLHFHPFYFFSPIFLCHISFFPFDSCSVFYMIITPLTNWRERALRAGVVCRSALAIPPLCLPRRTSSWSEVVKAKKYATAFFIPFLYQRCTYRSERTAPGR